jgi:hypothetical protein
LLSGFVIQMSLQPRTALRISLKDILEFEDVNFERLKPLY